MRVLVTSVPGWGHINPMVPLVQALVDGGDEVVVAAAGALVAPLWSAHGQEPRPYGGMYEHLYVDVYPRSLQPSDWPHIRIVQPLGPGGLTSRGEHELPALVTESRSTPLAYVTFGTVFSNDAALSAVVEAACNLSVRAVVTVGPDGDPTSLGPQPPNVHVARYIPQDQLLPHCSAVVSHAGSGTFLAALAAGLPQVCLPQAADQFLNAAACEQSGTGITLAPGTATVEEVTAALGRVLSDTSFRTAAERVSREIAAMPSPHDVAELLRSRYG